MTQKKKSQRENRVGNKTITEMRRLFEEELQDSLKKQVYTNR